MIIIFSFSWIFGPYEPVALNKTLRCRVFNRKELKQGTEAETEIKKLTRIYLKIKFQLLEILILRIEKLITLLKL